VGFYEQKITVNDRDLGRPIKFLIVLISCSLLWLITACQPPQRVTAEERLFLDLKLEFLDSYELPLTSFKNTPVGGLSAITYDRERNKFYILSDDRGNLAPARFYTAQLNLNSNKIDNLNFEEVTFLKDTTGEQYPAGSIDPEGLALSPRGTVFVSSEGDITKGIAPFVGEFDLVTGQKKLDLPIPERYLSGIRENLGFEALTINRNGLLKDDPFRLFTATESSLLQDKTQDPAIAPRLRFLHYSLDSVGSPILVAEHMYLLDRGAIEVISNGLTELVALDKEGYFLSLERTFGFTGAGAKIYQMVIANANDTSNIESLKGEISQVRSLKKQLLFDLQTLGIYLDNLEGMALGPRLSDGSQSLLLISDNNFNKEQVTQLLLLSFSL
jgi:hypothetical protein